MASLTVDGHLRAGRREVPMHDTRGRSYPTAVDERPTGDEPDVAIDRRRYRSASLGISPSICSPTSFFATRPPPRAARGSRLLSDVTALGE